MNSSFFLTLTTVATAIGLLSLLRKLRFHQEDNIENDSSSSSPSSSLSLSTVPPPSSSSSHIWMHDVFPSFRGEDVRRNFLSHVQSEFERKGITLFIDNEIKRGESIGPELIRAIRGSKIAVILLSRNYASSKWCLDELVEIMNCREKLGQTVMAVFYEVDPSDVKKLTGDFGRVFRKTCVGKTKECIEKWRQALAEVATVAGYHSNNWDNEAAMIQRIATDISNMLNNFTPSNDFDWLVGMRAHLRKMEPLLCLGSDEVRMIGIWGPPGIGKTTLARVAFSQLSNSFQLSVFMDDLKTNPTRLCSDDYSTKLQLQQLLMSQIIDHKDMVVSHLGVVPNRLKDKKVLVVLDGVDQSVQLEAMAKDTLWFGPGSRIIITAQDQRLFRAHGVNHVYKVNLPTNDEALQIFCTYCFGQKSPKDGFEELAWEVTQLVGELPLGLRVMGSYFRGMSKQEWIKSLPRLRTNLEADIQSILKFSYDALDDEDKYLFLHIACFFNSEKIHKVEGHLAKKFVEVRQRLNVLAERSLISIDEWGYIKMHSLLEKLGREIVCKQSIHEPGQRQFLYNEGEICEVMTGDSTGSKSVIGINFDYRIGEELEISEKAFKEMSNLQFLRVDGVKDQLQLTGGLNYLPHKLQLLKWNHFPMACFPSTLNVEFLVELVMRHSKLEKLWEGIKPLGSLKWMDLSYSENLKELPDLSTARSLEILKLPCCSSLIKLPSLSGYSLEELDMWGCSSLVEFSSFVGSAVNLRVLNLRNCSHLVELPLSRGSLQKLQKLRLNGCSKLEVLTTNINLESLEYLDIGGCSSLDLAGWSTIGNAVKLRTLNLSSLPQLLELPSFIGNANKLEVLDLSNCSNLVEIPLFIGNLQKLRWLRLKGCSKLEVLPTNINLESLDELDIGGCSSLDLGGFYTAVNLQTLNLSSLPQLLVLPYFIGNATNLKGMDLSNCSNLVELPLFIGNLQKWKRLRLEGCSKLEVLPTNINLESLDELDIGRCSSLDLAGWSTIGNAVKLRTLNLSSLPQLLEVPSFIENAINLVDLKLSNCSNLVELPLFIGNLQKLERLRLEGCSKLEVLPTNINLESLDELNLSDCSMLKRFPEISTNIGKLNLIGTAIEQVPPSIVSWPCLKVLEMSYFENLKDFSHALERITHLWLTDTEIQELPPCVNKMSRLKRLFLNRCRELVSLTPISDSKLGKLLEGIKPLGSLKWMDLSFSKLPTNLEKLDLSNCSSLIKLPSLSGSSLEELNMDGCSSLVEFSSFVGNAVKLRVLDLSNCSNLVELPLSHLQKLATLRLEGCSKLEVLPTNINLESLDELDIGGCSSLDLAGWSTIGNAVKLRKLNLSSLPQLLEVPSFIENAINLVDLKLSNCSNLVELPLFIGNLQKLRWLRLKGCSKLEVLPTNINLISLYGLDVSDCSTLKIFPQISTNIRFLNIRGTAIEQVPPSIMSWPRLQELWMSYFENLKEFPHALERITHLWLTDKEIQEVPTWVKKISHLRELVLKGCRKLVSLPPISDSIWYMGASDCESLEILECSFHNPRVCLNFANCFKLNQEARDLIIQNSEEAILPGGQVPAYFTHRATGGGPLTIKLNEKPLPQSMWFKACILLVNNGDHEACSEENSMAVDVIYQNSNEMLYPALAEHLYTFKVEAEVTSSELLFEFKLRSDDDVWKIGECGLVQH